MPIKYSSPYKSTQVMIAVKNNINDFFIYFNKYFSYEEYASISFTKSIVPKILETFWSKEHNDYRTKVKSGAQVQAVVLTKKDLLNIINTQGKILFNRYRIKPIHINQIELFKNLKSKYDSNLPLIKNDFLAFNLALKQLRRIHSAQLAQKKKRA